MNLVDSCDLNAKSFPKSVGEVSAIVAITDGLSESSETKVKKFAKDLGKHFIALPRKHADWANRVRPFIVQEEDMARPLAVETHELNPFLNDFMALAEKGSTLDDMLPLLKKYWKHGSLSNGEQLRNYIIRLKASDRCPPFFEKWWQRNDPVLSPKGGVRLCGLVEEQHPLTRTNGYHPKIGDAVANGVHVNGAHKTNGRSAKLHLEAGPPLSDLVDDEPVQKVAVHAAEEVDDKAALSELNDMLDISETDNKELRARVADLEKKLAESERDKRNESQQARAYADAVTVHTQRITALEEMLKQRTAEVGMMKQRAIELSARMPSGQDNLRKLIESFRLPWKLGAMDAPTILGIIMDFKPKDESTG